MNSDSRLRDSTATAVEQKMAVEETVFEAESNNVDGQHICLDKCDTLSKGKCALRKVADPMSSDSRLCDSAVTAVENQAPQGVSSERNVSLNENSRDTENILEPRAIYTHCPSSASSMKKPQAPKQQMIVNAGLEEIQEEIDRLTERLAELHLQKRKHEAILKQTQEDREKYAVPDYIMTANRSVARNNKQENKKGAECPAGQVNIMNGPIRNGVNARGTIIRQNSKIPQLQGVHNAGSKSNEDKSLGPPPRRVAQCSIASGSKLSEMRRSVSSSGTKIESSSNERQKSSRRLSLGGIAASESRSQNQLETQVLVKSTSFKGTPSRVVSSRYGRPITPDACRPCAPGPSQQNRSKRKDRPSVSALSPLPSITLSPSQKSCIPRSGYPSRSGLSTPTRDRQLIKPSAPSVSSSMQTLPATMSSSIFRSQERFRLFHTPRCSSHLPRLDSPKSTAALYKCLELLLEDSKHFFKTLSPVRSNVGRSPLDQEPATSPSSCFPQAQNIPVLSSVEATLPAINTCRLEFTSPRDSGCVKRISDGQSRRSFFAMESS
ncbi:hypothetical protein KP509_1Z115900 [Ceratopteris richardii]|nr:hypothetical protein KP509_1Z115900 [Ceratopteris richardii]